MGLFDAKVVYILSDTPYYVRATRVLPILARLFREVHFIGCSRGKKWKAEDGIPGVFYHVEDRTLPHGASSIGPALGFMGYVRRVLREVNPDVVIATNEEYILPFGVGFFPRPKKLVCDLTDSLSIRMMGPLRHLTPVWSLLTKWAMRIMDGLVEVSEERLARHSFKPACHTLVYNSPTFADVTPMEGLPAPAIYVCGSAMDRLSGIETLLAAVERVPEMQIVFAGRPIGTWVREHFTKHPKVHYLGEVTPQESLQIAKACRAVLAHYKPFNLNYIYAAPNKLFDAMMLGVPLLMNTECKASALPQHLGFGVLTPFDDVDAMEQAVRSLISPDTRLTAHCQQAMEIFRTRYSAELMEARWIELFKSLHIN